MIGQKLGGRYEVIRELGRGGMGIVFLARDQLLEREVAVKLIGAQKISAQARERFLREARLIARLDHPAILPVHDLGEQDGSLFFVMPYVEGSTLRDLLDRGGLPLAEALRIIAQVAGALEYGHAHGVVHRDVKPENILVDRGPLGVRARLSDFGIALTQSDERLTRPGGLVGTPHYVSPEQIANAPIDGRSDVYALGVILYECLAGQPPFVGPLTNVLYRIAHEPATLPSHFGSHVDSVLEALVMKCLAKEPAERVQTAAELQVALERHFEPRLAAGDASAQAVTASAPKRASVPPPSVSRRLIGRERELAVLGRGLDAALAGSCHVALVAGEPGSGKQRLVEELERLALARGMRVLQGELGEGAQSYPYQGFVEIIEHSCRSATSLQQAAPDFSDLAPGLLEIFPALQEVPGFARTVELDAVGAEPPWDRTRIFELLARTLGRIASLGPSMFVLTRLHNADVSLDALQYVCRRLAAQPVLILGTYTSSEVDASHPLTRLLDGFRGSRRFTLLELEGLTGTAHSELVETLIPGRASQALLERLHALTQGNPYFTIELARSLLDSGAIVRGADGLWTASCADTISPDAIPDTIREAVVSRLSRLSEAELDTLRTASVLGTSFDYRELETLADNADTQDLAVQALVDGGFLKEERRGRVDRLAFASALLHGVVYASLPRRARRKLHARAARALEALERGRPKAALGKLLVHYAEADDAEAVRSLGLEIGREALAAYAMEDAMAAARKVLAFSDDATPEAARAEGEACRLLAAVHRSKGELEEALHQSEAAARAFERAGDAARICDVNVEGAAISYEARRFSETERWLARALPALRDARDPRLEEHLVLAATVFNLRGDAEAAGRAVREAEQLRRDAPVESTSASGVLRVAHASAEGVAVSAGWATDAGRESKACAFDTLVTVDRFGNAIPRLAESWEANPDSTSFTFTLRDGVHCHDGRTLRAADVAGSFERTIKASVLKLDRAFAAVKGVREFVDGGAEHVSGIRVEGERRIAVDLDQPLAAYPLCLTDAITAVAIPSEADPSELVGTGPFAFTASGPDRLVLRRHPLHFAGPPKLEAIEFVDLGGPDQVVDAFRSNRIDVAMDLPIEHVERLLSDCGSGARLFDLDRRVVRFAVCNTKRPLGSNPNIRRALFESLPIEAMTWHHVGASAQAAFTLIPPGIRGHDSTRRRKRLTDEEIGELVASAPSRKLAVCAPPTTFARYRTLFEAVFEFWRRIGFDVGVEVCTLKSYLERVRDPSEVDVVFCGWMAAYADAASFTEDLFHSRAGVLSAFFGSTELDHLLDEARRESSPERGADLYRHADELLVDSNVVLPLLGGMDPAVVRAEVSGLEPRALCPYASYEKAALRPSSIKSSRRGWLVVPVGGQVSDLDPARAWTEFDMFHCCFEGLTTESRGANVVPYLAESVESDDAGRTYRVRLRDHLRFHDGRKVTGWHVRSSWERALKTGDENAARVLRFIAGADRVRRGLDSELSGVTVTSSLELCIELEQRMPAFRAMLGDLSTSVVADVLDPGLRERGIPFVGTGPFRVKAFDPGRRIELEANPFYWRAGYPKSNGISFSLGIASDEARRRLAADQVSLLCDQFSAEGVTESDVEVLEVPVLATAALVFNTHSATFGDLANRRAVAESIDALALAREHMSSHALGAQSYLPPGLLGHAPAPLGVRTALIAPRIDARVRIVMMESLKQFPRYAEALLSSIATTGLSIEIMPSERKPDDRADLLIGAWMADYPDADSMVRAALHSRDGLWGPWIASPEVDRISEQAAMEVDPAVRRRSYQRIEELLQEQCLLVPLFHPTFRWLGRPSLRGLSSEHVGLTRGLDFAELWIDR